MSDSNSSVLRYALESEPGVIPTTQFREMLMTSLTWGRQKAGIESQRISSDPQLHHFVAGTRSSQPSVGVELSARDLDIWFPAFCRSAWQDDTPEAGTSRLENGALVPTMVLELDHTDNEELLLVRRATPGSWSLQAEVDQIVTGTFSFMGHAPEPRDESAGTGEPIAAPDNEPFNSVDHITLMEEGGSTITKVNSFSLNVDLGARPQHVLGLADPYSINLGKWRPTGTVGMWWESYIEYQKALNHGASSFLLRLVDGNGNQYDFRLPRLFYTDGDPDISGPDSDIPLNLNWVGVKDPTTGKSIQIDRTLAYS